MRPGSRVLAVLLAAVVWIYAGVWVASRPMAHQAITPSVLDVAVSSPLAVMD
jgi:ABC-type anion transport system duplicated permease subunit